MAKKKVLEACDLSSGRVTPEELSEISATVDRQLEQARANIRFASARHGGERGATEGSDSGVAVPPSTNRGGNTRSRSDYIAATLVLEDGKVLEIPARRTWGGSAAFLDWCNFTTDEIDFFHGRACITDHEIIERVSYRCERIFGFGITKQRDSGANFYDRSYILGEGYGMVCHGGQRDTVLVMLSGEGCAAAKEGWEKRLYEFLSNHCGARAKLTRVDLAHDCYNGEMCGPLQEGQVRRGYSVDKADSDFDAGLFKAKHSGGRMPNHEYRGNWKRPTGKGRTLYIGNRDNGKFLRVYEKGRQLGDKLSEWTRIEAELKSIDRQLPFEVLLEPGQYLAATYPALAWISEHQERILTTQKKTEISYKSMCEWLKRQVGPALNVMMHIEGSAAKVLEMVRRDEIPKRLQVPMWQTVGECLHEWAHVQPSKDCFDEMALA